MTPLWDALTESVAHGIFTVQAVIAAVLALFFVVQFLQRPWWGTQTSRLIMLNMVAWTLAAVGAFLYRLSMQEAALTVFIPTGFMVIATVIWFIRKLHTNELDPCPCNCGECGR